MRLILNGILLLFLSLGTFTVSGALAQQTTDNAQAKIWHRALLWIYEDNNKTAGKNAQKPAPQVSNESVAQLEKELAAASKANQDEYNFYTRLYQPVQVNLAKEKAVSNEILINAIIAEATKKPDRKVENLHLELETITSMKQVLQHRQFFAVLG